MRSERCTQCGRWITDPDTLFLKKYACNYFCSDGCQSAWKRDREYEAQRTRDRLDSNPVHKAAPIIIIPGGFCWNVDKNFSAVTITYGWLKNIGDQESESIDIEISVNGGNLSGGFTEKYTITNQLLPGYTLRGGTYTIQLPRRITGKDSFAMWISCHAINNRRWHVGFVGADGFIGDTILLEQGWTKKQLKKLTEHIYVEHPITLSNNNLPTPVTVQIEPPASKKTAAPQPVVTKDTPVDAAPKGSDTKVTITGASYSYGSGKCTLKASRVQNDANHGTGSLKIVFWFSTGGQYNGGTLNGYQMAESLIGNPLGQGLSKGFGYPDVNVTADLTGNPPKGSYQPVITVNEKCEDGIWYIVGWANFTNPQQWK